MKIIKGKTSWTLTTLMMSGGRNQLVNSFSFLKVQILTSGHLFVVPSSAAVNNFCLIQTCWTISNLSFLSFTSPVPIIILDKNAAVVIRLFRQWLKFHDVIVWQTRWGYKPPVPTSHIHSVLFSDACITGNRWNKPYDSTSHQYLSKIFKLPEYYLEQVMQWYTCNMSFSKLLLLFRFTSAVS